MTPEKFIKSVTTNVSAISASAIKKADIKFALVSIDLAPGPGFTTIQFMCEAHNCVIRMCPVPLIGADNMMPNGITYAFAVISQEQIGSQTIALICTSLLDTFECNSLESAVDGLSEDMKNIFRIQVEKTSEYHEGLYTNAVLATIEVNDKAFSRILSITNAQLKSVATARGIVKASQANQPKPNQAKPNSQE